LSGRQKRKKDGKASSLLEVAGEKKMFKLVDCIKQQVRGHTHHISYITRFGDVYSSSLVVEVKINIVTEHSKVIILPAASAMT